MIICSHSNIDIIQGVIEYGDAEGITDWRISNTNAGILNILNSTSTNARLSILENGNVGIGTNNPASMLDIVGDTNITGVYKKNNRDVINDTSNYILSSSNIIVQRILTEVGNGSNYVSRLTTTLNTRVDDTSNYVLSASSILSNSKWTDIPSVKAIYYNPIPITSSPSATTTGTTMTFTYTTETAGTGTGQSLYTINVPATGIACDILIIGGGGGGAKTDAGGGGAGGLIYIQNITLTGNYTIKVGKGGLGGASGIYEGIVGAKGSNTSFIGTNANYTAYGGGGGGYGYPSDVEPGNLGPYGSSGGLGDGDITRESFNVNTVGQGYLGGLGTTTGGGGGGSGGAGVNSGDGGIGTQVNITGTNLYYAGGGGGGHKPSGTSGGLGGGGSATYYIGNNATFYGGGGGGGGDTFGNGGNGFEGIVILRVLSFTTNVGIGTTNPISKLHIYDDIANITKLTIQNNYTVALLPTLITVSGATSTTIGTTDRCISFPYTSDSSGLTGQTQYTFSPTQAINCDILLVGGGGGGTGAGGGGGGYVYNTNINLPAGSYTVRVGNGGAGYAFFGYGGYQPGSQGYQSTFTGGSISYTAYGGGSGGANANAAPSYTTGQVGSYGGTGMDFNQVQTYTSAQGNRGGNGIRFVNYGSGGGGGGAGAIGGTAYYVAGLFCDPGRTVPYSNGGTGGNGLPNSITGTTVYYAGGGTGGANTDFGSDTSAQVAPLGGGGLGARTSGGNGGNGTDGLGGGGGGGDFQRTTGARGGSGIIIIRYRFSNTLASIELIRGNSTDSNIDYKIGNYNGDFKIVSSTSSVDTDYIRITSAGASIYNPTGSPQWSTVSDRRIKENIEKASYDKCYDNISKLELYRFNYIKELNNINKDLKQLGYIAQEVQDIFPKAVSSYEFNNYNLSIPDMLSIDITQINYSLYGAVKKLIEMYNNKKTRLQRLKYILNNNTSNVAIEDTTCNMILDNSNVVIESSNVVIESSNVVIESSNVVIDNSNVVIDNSNVVIDNSNVVIEDTSMLA